MVNGQGNTYPTGKRVFHIAHLNVQSINNKFDLVIYATHRDEQFAHLWMSEDLNVLCTWCNKNHLYIFKV